jgi:hypothetical protein
VIADGGASGAALFSRPKPQSKGETPGGVRLLSSYHQKSAKKHRREPDLHHRASTVRAVEPSARAASSGSAGANAPSTAGGGAQQASGQEIKGVLIAPSSTHSQDAVDPGAPGFHSAGAGGNQTPWLAIGIAGGLSLCTLLGSQLERRRTQVIL